MQKFYTVGMAGHIDHGKTTLTKALTGVDTDRLKEEKLRNISIEPGFAPLVQTDDLQISIIDVPGHERFIRQMIAGVAGIDYVVLVVAADEGVMPQTKEHLAILSLLGIERGCVAVTKVDKVEEGLLSLVEEDIKDTVEGTFLENAPIHLVDGVSKRGVETLKTALIEAVTNIEKRSTNHPFRLPIDQVFTIKGHGVIVRGTVFDGQVRTGETVTVLPIEKEVRVRQIQSHHEQKEVVYAGQRAALNLGGISHQALKRGHVLVKDDFYTTTTRIDVVFYPLDEITYDVKQRQPIKCYAGTAEVTGRIIFFDRNEIKSANHVETEILMQVELDEQIVVTRGDRFILRRATPVETIGGGWIIDPHAEKHRFGQATIDRLKQVKEGTAEERIKILLKKTYAQTKEEIIRSLALSESAFDELKSELTEIEKDTFTLASNVKRVTDEMKQLVAMYHEAHPLRQGINKAEIISDLQTTYPKHLIEFSLKRALENGIFQQMDDLIALHSFKPHFPKGWEKRMEESIATWEKQGAEVENLFDVFSRHEIAETFHMDLYHFLLHTNLAYEFDEGRLISRNVALHLKDKLLKATKGEPFTIQKAREVTGLSRKNLIPLLELFDRLGFTERKANERIWRR